MELIHIRGIRRPMAHVIVVKRWRGMYRWWNILSRKLVGPDALVIADEALRVERFQAQDMRRV